MSSSASASACPGAWRPAAQELALTVGERYPVGERSYTLTPRLAEAVMRSRQVLIEVAAHREVITYGGLSEAIGGAVLPRHMGPLMHMLGHDCAERGEPSLPALVINQAKGEVGTADDAWAPPERSACWDYWAPV
ncbi:hypothetical protein [Actinomyces ruminis]|uniref:Uncharacterized protein n=1 Tax=Actinomyces ruminis TaxID=1937003 RepID=A0ABX4M9S3_9ACTO|nr:hypothetical protein [Actinomyces ruminis]PHP52190.1 hypothetical protein BW737_010985 [Actinomyces ruminis]